MASLKTVIYVSRPLILQPCAAMIDIVRQSMRNNSRDRITGVLFYGDDEFFQVVEGPAPEVDALMARIVADPRHEDVEILDERPVAARRFPLWPMKFVDSAWAPGGRDRFSRSALIAATARAQLESRIDALTAP